MESTKTTRVYIAGDMLTAGARLLREKEKRDVLELRLSVYCPQDNKEINDKPRLDSNTGLAEKIVEVDTEALFASDVIIIEPLPSALGTMIELGQLKGMKDVAQRILDILQSDTSTAEREARVRKLATSLTAKRILPHYEDIRRFEGATETGDRRALGINQYLYGVCLDLSGGRGFFEWSEILEILRGLQGEVEVSVLPGPAAPTDDARI